MSRAAEAWFFDECEIRGSEGWVLVTLCNVADDDGLAALSKRSLVAKTHMHETTVWRALHTMRDAGVVEFVEGETGPEWWAKIPTNRRPRLVRLTAFLGSRFATSPATPGIAQGSRKRRSGVAQGSRRTPSDLPVRDASFKEEITLNTRARDADPECVTCHGTGRFYNATAGAEAPCRCTWEPDYTPTPRSATRPPDDFGLPARKGA